MAAKLSYSKSDIITSKCHLYPGFWDKSGNDVFFLMIKTRVKTCFSEVLPLVSHYFKVWGEEKDFSVSVMGIDQWTCTIYIHKPTGSIEDVTTKVEYLETLLLIHGL